MNKMMSCDWCGARFASKDWGGYTKDHTLLGGLTGLGAKYFCSRRCMEEYQKNENELEAGKNRKKESRLREEEEESQLRRERAKEARESFKKDFNTVIDLFKNNSDSELPSNKNLKKANNTSKDKPEEISILGLAIGFIIIIAIIKLIINLF